MLQQDIHMKSRIYKEVQERNKKRTVLLKKATIDYAKLMQLTIFCKEQGIPSDYFEPASQRFMDYWNRFFQNFVLHELYYEFSEAGDFALTVNFQRETRGVKGEMNALKNKAAELLSICLREIDLGKLSQLDQKAAIRQKEIDELELEYKNYREVTEHDLQEKTYYLERLQVKYKQMDKNLSARQQRISDLEKDHVNFRQEAARNIQAKSNQLDSLQGRYEQLNEELSARQQRINTISRDHEFFRKQAEIDVKSKNQQLEVLQDRYEKLENDVSFYEERIKKIELEHQLYRQRTEKDIEQKNNEVAILQDKLLATQQVLDQSNPNFDRYKVETEESLVAKNTELMKLEQKYQEITTELTNRQQKVGKLETTIEAFEKAVESEMTIKDRELSSLQNNYEKLTVELADRQAKIESIEKAKQELATQSAREIKAKDEKINQLKDLFKTLPQELAKSDPTFEVNGQHELARRQMNQDISAKNAQLHSLQNKYSLLEEKLSSRQGTVDTLEVEYASFRNQVEADIKTKKKQLEELQSKSARLRPGNSPSPVIENPIVETPRTKASPVEKTTTEKRPLTGAEAIVENIIKETLSEDLVKRGTTAKVGVQQQERTNSEKSASSQKTSETISQKWEQDVKKTIDSANDGHRKKDEPTEEIKAKVAPLLSDQVISENSPDLRHIKRFSDVHLEADFRHLGESEKAQVKGSPKVESLRERLKASVAEQVVNDEAPAKERAQKPATLPNTGVNVTEPKDQLEIEIRGLFKQAQRTTHEKRVKIQKDDYYTYTTAIDFLDYQWSQAMLRKDPKNTNKFLSWVKQFIDCLPSFRGELDENVRKPMFNKTSYLTNLETLTMLKAYALLNRYLELHCEASDR